MSHNSLRTTKKNLRFRIIREAFPAYFLHENLSSTFFLSCFGVRYLTVQTFCDCKLFVQKKNITILQVTNLQLQKIFSIDWIRSIFHPFFTNFHSFFTNFHPFFTNFHLFFTHFSIHFWQFYASTTAFMSWIRCSSDGSAHLGTQFLRFWRKIWRFGCDFDVLETNFTKIELWKPLLKIWNRALKTLNPKNQNRIKKSSSKP